MAHMGYVGFRFEIWELSKKGSPCLVRWAVSGSTLGTAYSGKPRSAISGFVAWGLGLTASALSNPSSHRLSSTATRDFRCNCTMASRRNNYYWQGR